MENIREFVLEHIQSQYTIPEGENIDNFNYVEKGYIDSIGIVSFVIEIEDAYGITFTDEELTAPGFQVVGTLISMIQQKVEAVG